MKLNKDDIKKALETITVAGEGQNMVESGALQNIVTFGDEVIIDLKLSTPALHIKKRAEVDVMKAIHKHVYAKAKVQVKISVEAKEKKATNEIKVNPSLGFKILSPSHLGKEVLENLQSLQILQ